MFLTAMLHEAIWLSFTQRLKKNSLVVCIQKYNGEIDEKLQQNRAETKFQITMSYKLYDFHGRFHFLSYSSIDLQTGSLTFQLIVLRSVTFVFIE